MVLDGASEGEILAGVSGGHTLGGDFYDVILGDPSGWLPFPDLPGDKIDEERIGQDDLQHFLKHIREDGEAAAMARQSGRNINAATLSRFSPKLKLICNTIGTGNLVHQYAGAREEFVHSEAMKRGATVDQKRALAGRKVDDLGYRLASQLGPNYLRRLTEKPNQVDRKTLQQVTSTAGGPISPRTHLILQHLIRNRKITAPISEKERRMLHEYDDPNEGGMSDDEVPFLDPETGESVPRPKTISGQPTMELNGGAGDIKKRVGEGDVAAMKDLAGGDRVSEKVAGAGAEMGLKDDDGESAGMGRDHDEDQEPFNRF